MALPFVFAGEGGVAAGKVEDAVEGALVLLLDVRVEIGLVGEIVLGAVGAGQGDSGVGGGGGLDWESSVGCWASSLSGA